MNIPRPEYPRPQLVREPWVNLNGQWEFEIDNAMVGFAKKYYEREHLDGEITVPFCPESVLSGIGNVDYMNAVWYKRDLDIPAEWKGKSVLVHFGAVDYFARVWVNGKFVGEHRGGYTPFSVDITEALKDEGNSIVLCAEDDTKGGHQPVGKQSQWYYSAGCSYTRTTGIWQTVFMEAVDRYYVKNYKVVTDIETVSAELTVQLNNYAVGCRITAEAFYNGVPMGIGSTVVNAMNAVINLPLMEKHLWEVGDGKLYDLKLTVEKDGVIYDTVPPTSVCARLR